MASNIGSRRVLGPLMGMAKETGSAVVLSQHVVFVSGKPKVAGSQGLLDTVRLCYMITVDKYNAALRVVRVHKSNGVRPDEVRFTLTSQPNGFKSVTWLDQEELTVRRTAWRQQDAAGVALRRPTVAEWMDAGGGTAEEAAAATGLPVEVVRAQLDAMPGVAQKKRLAVPWRR